MNKKLLTLLEAQLEVVSEDIKSELQKVIDLYKNGKETVKTVVKKTVDAVSGFFTSAGKIEITEETISFTKNEIINFFKAGNKEQPFYLYCSRFTRGLTECLADYKDEDVITFSKSELEFFKNTNLKSIGDKKAIEILDEKVLDMKVKEDRIELLKRYAVSMYHLKNQPLGEDGPLPNDGYAVIFGWIKFSSGEQAALCFNWNSGRRLWLLDACGFDNEWGDYRCFFSRKMLENLGS